MGQIYLASDIIRNASAFLVIHRSWPEEEKAVVFLPSLSAASLILPVVRKQRMCDFLFLCFCLLFHKHEHFFFDIFFFFSEPLLSWSSLDFSLFFFFFFDSTQECCTEACSGPQPAVACSQREAARYPAALLIITVLLSALVLGPQLHGHSPGLTQFVKLLVLGEIGIVKHKGASGDTKSWLIKPKTCKEFYLHPVLCQALFLLGNCHKS